jgi:hypothetical protein
MKVRLLFSSLAIFLGGAFFSACEIINPTEDTPSYLKINKIVLDPSKNSTETYGSASNNISDAWVFVNGKQIGTFELPASIPVLASGSANVQVLAGIYGDGQKGARFPFGFYTQFDTTLNLEPGKETFLVPKVKFAPAMAFPFDVYEDFTNYSGVGDIQIRSGSPYKLVANKDTLANFPYAAGAVGVVYAIPGISEPVVLESIFNGKLPQTISGIRAGVFLEFDYRSTVDFKVGVTTTFSGNSEPITDLTVRKNRTWTKMYVNLTDEVNIPELKNGTFRMLWVTNALSGSSDYFAIDNIRLLHF